jgi:hypothetical protein
MPPWTWWPRSRDRPAGVEEDRREILGYRGGAGIGVAEAAHALLLQREAGAEGRTAGQKDGRGGERRKVTARTKGHDEAPDSPWSVPVLPPAICGRR